MYSGPIAHSPTHPPINQEGKEVHRCVGGMEADEIMEQIAPFMGGDAAKKIAAKPPTPTPVASPEAVEAVRSAIAENDVTVFSKTTCPFCAETKMLLEMMDVS